MLRITVKEKPTFKKKRDNYARRLKTQKLINYLQSELRTSTTHGLPYIANTEIHWFERIFWAASFGISCAIIFVLLSTQYVRLMVSVNMWQSYLHLKETMMRKLGHLKGLHKVLVDVSSLPTRNKPRGSAITLIPSHSEKTQVSSSGTEAPIVNSVEKDYLNWNVSYPTIVLCPVRKIDDEILTNYVNETLNSTGYNLESYYSAIISVSLEALNVLDLPPPEILELIKPQDYAAIAADLFKRFNNQTLTTLIKWPIAIEATMTELGMCHIINSNVAILDDPTKWSDSTVAYSKNNIELSVHDIDFFVQILNYADAYKVYTLSPDEVILSGAPSLTFDTEGFLSFGVQITTTRASGDLKYIPLHLRKCRFMHETTSKRYPIYSYNRCLLECRIKMILKLCDCIPHFYKPLDNERICNLADLECVLEYKKEIMKLSASNETMEKFDNTDDLPRSSRDCGCLGNCEEDVFKNDRETFLPQETMNRLRISVSAFPKVRIKREIIFSFYDIFLRSGGVVNLCIGTSVISIMELLLTVLRIPIYEIMQIVKGVWRRYKKSQIPRLSNNKKQI